MTNETWELPTTATMTEQQMNEAVRKLSDDERIFWTGWLYSKQRHDPSSNDARHESREAMWGVWWKNFQEDLAIWHQLRPDLKPNFSS